MRSLTPHIIRSISALLPNEAASIIATILFFSLLILQSTQVIDLSARPPQNKVVTQDLNKRTRHLSSSLSTRSSPRYSSERSPTLSSSHLTTPNTQR